METEVPVILEWARYYASLGWCVIPIQPGKKIPAISWERYQKEKPTDDDLTKWFSVKNRNIAIVTGKISGLAVVDIDSDLGGLSIEPYISPQIETPSVKTPKGRHLYFKHPGDVTLSSHARRLDGCDFKGDGGYVVAPPSNNGQGTRYLWEKTPTDLSLVPLPIQYLTGVLSYQEREKERFSLLSKEREKELIQEPYSYSLNTCTSNKYIGTSQALQALPSVTSVTNEINFMEGSRDNSLFTVANSLKYARMNDENIVKVLEAIAKSWGETFDDPKIEKWIRDKVKSADKREDRRSETLAEEIRQWVSVTKGYMSVTECYRALQVLQKKDMGHARVVFHRLVKEGVIERHPSKDGVFRRIEKDCEEMEWWKADSKNIFELEWPFQLEKLVRIYPKNIIVVAGAVQAGKTAFLLSTAIKNVFKYPERIHYFNSETGESELLGRIENFELPLDDWKHIKFRFRSSNFADVIEPDDVNIIDYMEVLDNFYLVGKMIKDVFDKLRNGIAIIALQKKDGSDLGRGAEFGLEKPRLYLSMGQGKLKIMKAKNWAEKGVNPNGREFSFKLVQGCKFVDSSSNSVIQIEF